MCQAIAFVAHPPTKPPSLRGGRGYPWRDPRLSKKAAQSKTPTRECCGPWPVCWLAKRRVVAASGPRTAARAARMIPPCKLRTPMPRPDRKPDAVSALGRAEAKRGCLRNGNRSGPQFGADWPGRRCGARTRRRRSCANPAMPNGRCRLHGGKSTGPRTSEGRNRAAKGNWKHGRHSRAQNPLKLAERLIDLAVWTLRQEARGRKGLPAEECPRSLQSERETMLRALARLALARSSDPEQD